MGKNKPARKIKKLQQLEEEEAVEEIKEEVIQERNLGGT